MTRQAEAAPATVYDALAHAEAWIERAALLATLAYDVTELFHGTEERPAPFVIRRLSGGATTADPRNVEDVRNELMAAAERAREEARRILASTTEAPLDGHTATVDGGGQTAPPASDRRFEILTGGYEIAPNPSSPRARNWDHAARFAVTDDHDEVPHPE